MTTREAARGTATATVTEVQDFLTNPPAGFSVEALGSGCRVRSDPETSLVLVDDFYHPRGGKVVFHNPPGRKVRVQNLWEYTSMRKRLLSTRIYLLASACRGSAASEATVLQRCVVSVDGSDPFIRWQMERGLDWTISSVAGESYRVDVDLTEVLDSWAAKNAAVSADGRVRARPVWRDASFTLKYSSDALFDFPHWLGFSKRTFKLRLTRGSSG